MVEELEQGFIKGELPYSHGCGEGKYLMFLYLNFPDLEEMRQMYLQHYK